MRKLIFGFLLILIQAGLCSAAVTGGGLQFSSAASGVEANPLPERPNIVFILLDDLDERITPYWEAMPKTKSLLADKGLTFEQSFSPNPICCPARATLLTGLCSHNTGVLTNYGFYGGWDGFKSPLEIFDDEGNPVNNEERTLGVYLQQAGYKTMFTGKYLNGYRTEVDGGIPPVPPGWTEWHVFFGRHDPGLDTDVSSYYTGYDYDMVHQYEGQTLFNKHYPAKDSSGKDVRIQNYSTDVIRKLSVSFIQRQKGTEPLFMFINPTAPHEPLQPALRHKKLTQKWVGKLPKNENWNEEDVSDKSAWLKKLAPILRPFLQVTKDHEHPFWQKMNFLFPELEFVDRMGTLYAVDDLVAGVVKALMLEGRLENTILVFASDNGYNLGAHVLIQKQTPYDEALRVPLVVMGPGVRQGKTQAMVSQQDYLPTFLDLAGVKIPNHVNGRSFKDILITPDQFLTADKLNRELLIENNSIGGEIFAELAYALTEKEKAFIQQLIPPSYRGLRTRDYAYIEWHLEPPHEYELYDMINDEWQLDNLLSTKEGRTRYQSLVKDLQYRLEKLKKCEGADCL